MGSNSELEWLCKEHRYVQWQHQDGIACEVCKAGYAQFIGIKKRQAQAGQEEADLAVATAQSAKDAAELKAQENAARTAGSPQQALPAAPPAASAVPPVLPASAEASAAPANQAPDVKDHVKQ